MMKTWNAIIGFGLCLLAFMAAPPSLRQARAADPGLDGPYIGAFAGAAVLDSTVTFPATATSRAQKYVDQGGDGFILGLRAGWGRMVSLHGYAGVELEATLPLNVTSRLDANGTEYRARLRSDVGGFLRLGWSQDGSSLIFLRVGLSAPTQLFRTATGERGADWSLVPAVGLGAEVPIGHGLRGRVDFSYSWPDGDNRLESYRLTAGLVWRF